MPERIDYERTDLSVRGTIGAFVLLSVMILVVGASVWMLREEFRGETGASRGEVPAVAGSVRAPPLQVSPPSDLAELRRRSQAILQSTAWVDKEKGLVRIPIGHAMNVLSERGWPEGAP